MHSATLAVAAYALIGSSLASLFYLLRKNLNNCVKSPLHILSMSDALSSIFAGILFLINQLTMDSTVHLENNDIKNLTKSDRDILHILEYDEPNPDENELDNPTNCEFKYVMMQYGMFFIPFTNAFISLLGYSFHYITNIIRVDGTCMELIKPIKQMMQEETIKEGREAMEALSSPGSSISKTREQNFERIVSYDHIRNIALNILKEKTNQPSKYDKITLVSVVVEWLVPILITAILHLGEYQGLSKEQNLRNDECIFASNFPFDNCYPLSNQSEAFSWRILSTSTPYPVAVYNYIETEDSERVSNEDSEEIQNVVSNVYKLIQTALDNNERQNSSHYNSSDLWNITKFMEKSSTSNEEEIENEKTFFTSMGEAANETNLEPGMTTDSTMNLEVEQNLGTILETEIIYTTSENETDYSHHETSSIKPLYEKNKTDYNSDIISTETKKIMSQTEIFSELIKKIQTGIPKVNTKKKTRLNRKIQLKENSEFSISQIGSQCSKHQCFISTTFLKIHLFVLLFIVYFIPILISTILNICATYKFKQIKEKVETNYVTLKILTNFSKNQVEVRKKNQDNENINEEKLISWCQENQEESQEIKEIGEEQIPSIKIKIIDEEEIFANILEDLKKAEQFSKIFKINLLLAILLWTPLFMEVLSKVFLCTNVPNWLMDSSFLGAISFGVVRNYLNINMTKTFRLVDRTKKENSVHPIS